MAETPKSFGESSWEYLGHINLWWWIVGSVVFGSGGALTWLLSVSELLAGALGGMATVCAFLLFLSKLKHDGEISPTRLLDLHVDTALSDGKKASTKLVRGAVSEARDKRLAGAEAPAAKPTFAETEPKIERKGVRRITLPLDPESHRITSSKYNGEKNKLIAHLAKFYYAPEPNTPESVLVTAHIYFYHGVGTPSVYRAFRPIWFETETNKQLFKRAETHELILAMGGDERVSTYESSDREGHFRFEGVFDYTLLAEVELIIEREHNVHKQTFTYYLTKGPAFKEQL